VCGRLACTKSAVHACECAYVCGQLWHQCNPSEVSCIATDDMRVNSEWQIVWCIPAAGHSPCSWSVYCYLPPLTTFPSPSTNGRTSSRGKRSVEVSNHLSLRPTGDSVVPFNGHYGHFSVEKPMCTCTRDGPKTAINTAWLLGFLSTNVDWRRRAIWEPLIFENRPSSTTGKPRGFSQYLKKLQFSVLLW